MLSRYPTVAALLSKADLFGPLQGNKISLGWMPRLSRLWARAAGDNWLSLPSTVGVIDPLHSTGLAHALSGGVRRAAQILLTDASAQREQLLQEYDADVVAEGAGSIALSRHATRAYPTLNCSQPLVAFTSWPRMLAKRNCATTQVCRAVF